MRNYLKLFMCLIGLFGCELNTDRQDDKHINEEIRVLNDIFSDILGLLFTPPSRSLLNIDNEYDEDTIEIPLHKNLISLENENVINNCTISYQGRKYIESLLSNNRSFLSKEIEIGVKNLHISKNRKLIIDDYQNRQNETMIIISRIAFNKNFDEGLFYFQFSSIGISFGELIFITKNSNDKWMLQERCQLWTE